jgi:hypothetical protein
MMTLLEKTRALARAYNGNVVKLCRELGVTTRWFYTFLSSDNHDYGIKKVQRLYDLLTKEEA